MEHRNSAISRHVHVCKFNYVEPECFSSLFIVWRDYIFFNLNLFSLFQLKIK